MKQKILLLFYFFCLTFMVNSQTPSISPQIWTLSNLLSDEFDSFDATKWSNNGGCNFRAMYPDFYLNPKSNGNNLNNISYGIPSGSSSGSALQLTIKKEISTTYENCPWYQTNNKVACNYSSAQIQSNNKYQYGYFEIRAKLPITNSINVGGDFWLFNQKCSDNIPSGNRYLEIDGFEMCSIDPSIDPINIHTAHCNSCWDYNLSYDYHMLTFDNINFTSDYHIMAIDWQPDYIDWYIDNVLVKHVTNGGLIHNNDCPVSEQPSLSSMSIPLQILIDGCLSDTYYGYPLPNTTGYKFEVDYFRYYKKNPDITVFSANLSQNLVTLTSSTGITAVSGNPYTFNDTYEWKIGTTVVSTNNNYTPVLTNSSNVVIDNIKATQSIVQSEKINPPIYSSINSNTSTYLSYGGNTIDLSTNSSSQNNLIYISNTINSSTSFASNKSIIFKAKNGITLNGGFEVTLGSSLTVSSDITQ